MLVASVYVIQLQTRRSICIQSKNMDFQKSSSLSKNLIPFQIHLPLIVKFVKQTHTYSLPYKQPSLTQLARSRNYFGYISTNNEDYFPLYIFLIWVRVLGIFGGLVKFQNVDIETKTMLSKFFFMLSNYPSLKMSTQVKGKMNCLFSGICWVFLKDMTMDKVFWFILGTTLQSIPLINHEDKSWWTSNISRYPNCRVYRK